MKRLNYFYILATILFLLFPVLIQAQRSIGKVKNDIQFSENDLSIIQWQGKKFILLEQPKKLQEYGYRLYLSPDLVLRKKYNKELELKYTHFLRYDKFVGKTLKVINIEDTKFTSFPDKLITFEEEQSKIKLYAKTYKGYIDGIALIDDMDKAKEKWLGKIIYSKVRSIRTYDAESDTGSRVNISIAEPLKVIDIWWGFNSFSPLWIIVETTRDEQGYINVAYSWTNIYIDRWKKTRPWEKKFFEFNPREKYNWSKEIWNIINEKKIKIGMNKEQIVLSWGEPKKVNKSISNNLVTEQWVYKGQYLYFENDLLKSIQTF